ncbi:chloride channel protein [Planctomicrobium sp. SH664]|uniref:chloride channel protein n=1 Tax=Planctomicrobium sp. SH664 TaxID=3448125 RepID=UPI003F5C7B26
MNSILKRFTSIDWMTAGKWTGLSVLVGLISGLGAIVFQYLGQFVTHISLARFARFAPREAAGEHSLFHNGELTDPDPLMMILIMTIGGLLSGLLVYTFAPEAEGHGTDAAIDAFHNRRGRIRARIPFVKTLASALTLGTGGSGGREGPIAQIGASFGSYLGHLLDLSARDRRILLAAGIGAGIGSIFRAPLAGAIFASEILYSESDFEAEVIIPAATASVIGYSVYTLALPASVRHLPLFGTALQDYTWSSPLELLPYAILACALVLVAAFYIKTFYGVQKLFGLLLFTKKLRPALGAALAGGIGLGLYFASNRNPQSLAVLATGYGTLQDALTGAADLGVGLLLTIAAVKIVTTSLTISSGGSGGVFGPSIVIGGCVGAALGLLLQQFFPDLVKQPEAYGLVGMAGFFAACAHAPFSTIIMVSEMTGGYGLLLPTMWVSTIAFVLGKPWKLYSRQVPTRLDSPAHRGDFLIDILQGIRVNEVAEPLASLQIVPESMSLREIVQLIAGTTQKCFPVVDANGSMIGLFNDRDVRAYLFDQSLWALSNARDVMHDHVPSLTPDDDLNVAMRTMVATGAEELPVVDAQNRSRLLGSIRQQAIIAAYHQKLSELEQSVAETR